VVHTSLILVMLLLGKRTKLHKVPRLVVVQAQSSYLSISFRRTVLSCLGLWHCHLEWLLIPLRLLSVLIHYTTTPKSALDGLTPKAVTASDNLTLKTYSVRLLLTLQVLTLKTYSVRPNF
jgi:hypothetical protein